MVQRLRSRNLNKSISEGAGILPAHFLNAMSEKKLSSKYSLLTQKYKNKISVKENLQWECMKCGMQNGHHEKTCIKCDARSQKTYIESLVFKDIAHSGETWEEAKRKIDNAIDEALQKKYKGVKIIHGKGTEPGHTRVIRNKAEDYLRSLAKQFNGKLVQDKHTVGAHILYFLK